jgi:hypothetical protein
MKTFKIGDIESIPYGTEVKTDFGGKVILGKIVGKASHGIEQLHIIKCTDGQIPNENYSYNTFVAYLSEITVFEPGD